MKKQAILNWSSGKDSAYTLYKISKDSSINIKYLFTTMNEELDRISMHGVRKSLLIKQVKALGIELKVLNLPPEPSLAEYDLLMKQSFDRLKSEGIVYSVFGDIFLEDLRKYREKKLSEIGIKGLFPIWKIDSVKLIKDFIKLGFKAKIVSANAKYFDESFCGSDIDEDFLSRLPEGVDPCGENGEYHSFVYDGPIFNKPIEFELGEIVYKEFKPCNKDKERCDKDCEKGKYDIGFWYADLIG
jgi:uncharacterized protein (TIGR00290 family)